MSASHYQIAEIGNPILAQPAKPVTDFAAPELAEQIRAMETLMHERNGVGIAAPQIGVGLQLMIIASKPNVRYPQAPKMEPLLLVNPSIKWQSANTFKDWEGCLSVPGLRGLVTRPCAVKVCYQDRQGAACEMALDGFPARVFFHEYDHLLGKTFLDRVESTADLYSEKEYLKRINNQG